MEGRDREEANKSGGGEERLRIQRGVVEQCVWCLMVGAGRKRSTQGRPSTWQLQSPQNSLQKFSMEPLPQPSWSSSSSKEVMKDDMEVSSELPLSTIRCECRRVHR